MSRIYLEEGVQDLKDWLSPINICRLNEKALEDLGSEYKVGDCIAMLPYGTAHIPLSVKRDNDVIEVPFGIISSELRSKWANDVGTINDNKVVFIVNTEEGLMGVSIFDSIVHIGPLNTVVVG